MALRVLKKFDELDAKEVMLTGRRRPFATSAKRRERPKSAFTPGRRNDLSSAFPNRGREHRRHRSKGKRRPQSAGPVRKQNRESGMFRKAHVSPNSRPEAPEVDNIFGKKKRRPASAKPFRTRSDKFGQTTKNTRPSSHVTWNSRRLQTGRPTFGTAAGATFSGTNVESLAKRIIQPNFYFLRICLEGITENYGKKIFNVQITDLTNPNRPSHWYTDLSTQHDGHLLFRQTALRMKSKVSTKTVISPSHDFYWVQHPADLYGHAIRIEVFEQVGDLQRILIDRCAYFGKFDPVVVAEANKLQTALTQRQKEKRDRPRTAPSARPRASNINSVSSMHSQVAKNSVEQGIKLEPSRSTHNQVAKIERRNYQSSVDSNRHENKGSKVPGICRKVRLEREASPRMDVQSPGGKIAGWNENGYSPAAKNRQGNGRAKENNFRQHASQSPPPKLDVVAKRHPSPYLKQKYPLKSKKNLTASNEDLPSSFELLKSYRKQVLERMKYAQSEALNRRYRSTPPIEAEGEAIMINLSPTRNTEQEKVSNNGRAKVVVPISKFLKID